MPIEEVDGVSACGVWVWRLSLLLPGGDGKGVERRAVLIANDITHNYGTFTPQEADTFVAASRCVADK